VTIDGLHRGCARRRLHRAHVRATNIPYDPEFGRVSRPTTPTLQVSALPHRSPAKRDPSRVSGLNTKEDRFLDLIQLAAGQDRRRPPRRPRRASPARPPAPQRRDVELEAARKTGTALRALLTEPRKLYRRARQRVAGGEATSTPARREAEPSAAGVRVAKPPPREAEGRAKQNEAGPVDAFRRHTPAPVSWAGRCTMRTTLSSSSVVRCQPRWLGCDSG
jgi:hypothetical protein